MRELTKSMLSFTFAMPLYGMRQMLNLSFPQDMSRPFDQATEGFESLTGTVTEHLGPTMKGLFDAGDRIQRGLVDLMFSFVPADVLDPDAWVRTGSGMMQRSIQGLGQAAAAAAAAGPPGAGFGPAGSAPGAAGAQPAAPPAGQAGWGPIPPSVPG